MGSDNKEIVTVSDDGASGLGKLGRLITRVRSWDRKKQIIVGAATVVFVVLLVWLIVDLVRGPGAPPKPLAVLTDAQVNQVVLQDMRNHDYSKAQATITQESLHPNDKSNLLLLATVYEGEKNYSQSLATYKQIQVKYGMDYELAIDLGQVETLLKDKSSAIRYYQQAISLIQKANPPLPNAQSNITGLQYLIKGLQ